MAVAEQVLLALRGAEFEQSLLLQLTGGKVCHQLQAISLRNGLQVEQIAHTLKHGARVGTQPLRWKANRELVIGRLQMNDVVATEVEHFQQPIDVICRVFWLHHEDIARIVLDSGNKKFKQSHVLEKSNF